jgi:hypothetical protein
MPGVERHDQREHGVEVGAVVPVHHLRGIDLIFFFIKNCRSSNKNDLVFFFSNLWYILSHVSNLINTRIMFWFKTMIGLCAPEIRCEFAYIRFIYSKKFRVTSCCMTVSGPIRVNFKCAGHCRMTRYDTKIMFCLKRPTYV